MIMDHDSKVRRISGQIKNHTNGKPVSMKKKGVSHQVPKPGDPKKNDDKIDISDLDAIISIDTENMICTAESGVTFYDLVTETLKHNVVPVIVPELKTITIGGAVSGCSVESMSYKNGGFHDNCLEYKIVTSTGDVLICAPDNENSDVFQMIHGSFGTLGILTKLKFKLIKAKPYVHVKYIKYDSFREFKEAIRQHYQAGDVEFMDGIIHSPKKCILCIGAFTDSAPYSNSCEWMKVYYKTTAYKKEDYLKTKDYYFRYDADCHWITRNYGLEIPLLRFLLGKQLLSSTNVLETAHKIGHLMKHTKPEVVIDVFVPYSNLDKFFNYYKKEFNYYPLWIVPYQIVRMYDWISEDFMKGIDDTLYFDLAIYGMRQTGGKNYYKMLEDILEEVQGIKTLISYNYYDEERFWRIFNKDKYFKVKKKTDPDNIFRDLYGKTHGK